MEHYWWCGGCTDECECDEDVTEVEAAAHLREQRAAAAGGEEGEGE